jgi:hypothetical protein
MWSVEATAQGRRRAPEPQIPSPDGVFYACVRLDRDGDEGRLARLVGADESCRPREVRVQWNQSGPQGPQGVPGARGIQGEPGIQGEQGIQGPAGHDGKDGSQGPQGRPGVSVAMETVAVNTAECMGDGGVKLTLVEADGTVVGGPEFVCHGAKGEQGAQGEAGPAGTTGQSSTTYTTPLTNSLVNQASSSAACSGFSGFPVVVSVPANADVLVTAQGGLQVASSAENAYSSVDFYIVADSALASTARRVTSAVVGSVRPITPWSITRSLSLPSGNHTLGMCGQLVAGSATAHINSGPALGLQATLTVTIVTK